MTQHSPTLHLICGKIASGKSTLAAQLGCLPKTIVISEDNWLSSLYADQMSSVPDYVRCSAKLQNVMGPHVVALLNAGVSVILDFHANTVERRLWMRELIDAANSDHQLHVLDVPDEVCKERLRKRNIAGDHAFAATVEQFEQVTKHFVAPTKLEGFNIVSHRSDSLSQQAV